MGSLRLRLFIGIFSAVLWGCIYPDVHLTRYDLNKNEGGGVDLRFNFLLEGSPAPEADTGAASASVAGMASRSVLPGAFTAPAAYKVSVVPQAGGTTQTTYIRTASGDPDVQGGISLPAPVAIYVEVSAYSVWANDGSLPDESNCILYKPVIPFTAQEVAGGALQIKLNPLRDAVSTTSGGIDLTLVWPADLDYEPDTGGNQGITKITANLLKMDGTAIPGFSGAFQEITTIYPTSAALFYNNVPAGSYKLRLVFYRGSSPNFSPIAYFTEVVTVWPDSTANKWIDAAGVSRDQRLFSLDDFYDAAASVHGIIVKKVISGGPDIPLPTAMIGGSDTNNVVKTGLKDGDSIQFSVIFDEAAAMPSGKSLSSVKYHVNTNPAVTLTNADISYPQVQGSSTYTANFTLSVPSGLDDLYKVEVEVQAPDRVTTKTYTYTFAAAMLGTSTYYPSVKGAVTAAAGTAAVPDVITVLADIAMDSGNNLTIGSVKYIKLTSELGQTRTLKRAAGNTGSPLISMSAGELTLENIIVDGGAVWSGSTPPWGGQPSPAHDATNNTGAGGINAVMPLIRAYGMGAKLTLGSDAVLRNNNNTTDINESSGGAVNARNGAVVIIDGGEVSRNQTFRIGGGIMLLGTSSAHTTLTLITGSINNNNVVNHDGGGIACEGANIEIHGGVISRNCAKYGGGINSWRGGDTSFNNTLTISDGVISDNIARIGEAAGGGGGVNASDGLQFFMSGGLITGNTSPLGNGIFVAAACDSFKMSNGARIAANNDVYLTTGKAITIDGDLTEATPVATITPELPLTDGRQVLSGTTYLTPANIAKFAVSASGWTISDRMGEMGNIYGNRAASRVVSGTATYYDSLTAALAAAGGTVSSPDEITVLTNITLAAVPSEHYISNKHIKLISGGVQRTIKRGTGSEWAPLFTVQANASLTLENIVIDGGAVWASGSHAPGEPPSPATGANNTGITTNKCLIMVEGTNAKLILNADAVIQNNDNTDTQIGGSGIRVHGSTSEVRITSATAEVRYNKSSNSGGGIELDNGILVVSGKIHNNSAVGGGGGIKAAWNGSINISNGSITHNKTNTNGGGIYAHNFNGNFTMTAGTIAANTASNGGGIYLFTDNASTTFTMSGGIIGGSTAADANVATGGLGGGVYHNGNSFVISGTAQVTTNNAVYLPTGKTIAVGIITTTYTLAKIKPQNAAFGTQVLSGDSGYINANYNKFQLDESVTGRTIGSNGSLQ